VYELTVETDFSAAHRLRGYSGECEKLHGHNYRVEVSVAGEKLDSTGLLVDFRKLKDEVRTVVSRFEHVYLNELESFRETNPSAENLARIIFDELGRGMNITGVRVSRVRVWESDTSSASYGD